MIQPGGALRDKEVIAAADEAGLAMVFSGVFVLAASKIRFPLGLADQFFRLAKRQTAIFCEALRAVRNEHHVRTLFQNFARQTNRIFYALQSSGGAGAKTRSIHDDGIALDFAVSVQMGAVAGVKDGIVFQNDDRGFDRLDRRAP